MRKRILAALTFVASMAVLPFVSSSSDLCVFFVADDDKRAAVDATVRPVRFRDSSGDVLLYCAPAKVMRDLYAAKKIPTPMSRSEAATLIGNTAIIDGGPAK